jgi:putative ABC transport system permease protein
MRVGGDSDAFVQRLRAIVAGINAGVTIQGALPLDEVPNFDRFLATWGGLVALLVSLITVLLSAAGLYALMSFTVAERTREIGIRSALGARRARLTAILARRTFLQLLTGVAIGTVLTSLMLRGVRPDSDLLQGHELARHCSRGCPGRIARPACRPPGEPCGSGPRMR